jgi:thiosulfate dehydrogenase
MIRKWVLAAVVLLLLLLTWILRKGVPSKQANQSLQTLNLKKSEPVWTAPDSNSIPQNEAGDLVRYGKKLISSTAHYLGPKGSVAHISNGMNCQNCHLKAGTQAWAGSFGAVASTYPRFSDRRGSAETINQRITDCFERSMNGRAPDSNSREMKAMYAYLVWLGKDVSKGKKPRGAGLEILPFIDRPADPDQGKQIYLTKCQSCHGPNGEGKSDSLYGFLYPPLWGEHSYNNAAGLYRLSKFAGFIKDNMPFGSDYSNEQLSVEQAWDLAAFVNSQPRPQKKFKKDWPVIFLKPVDLEDGPFPDSFPSKQHKYGPFNPIAQFKKKYMEKSKP